MQSPYIEFSTDINNLLDERPDLRPLKQAINTLKIQVEKAKREYKAQQKCEKLQKYEKKIIFNLKKELLSAAVQCLRNVKSDIVIKNQTKQVQASKDVLRAIYLVDLLSGSDVALSLPIDLETRLNELAAIGKKLSSNRAYSHWRLFGLILIALTLILVMVFSILACPQIAGFNLLAIAVAWMQGIPLISGVAGYAGTILLAAITATSLISGSALCFFKQASNTQTRVVAEFIQWKTKEYKNKAARIVFENELKYLNPIYEQRSNFRDVYSAEIQLLRDQLYTRCGYMLDMLNIIENYNAYDFNMTGQVFQHLTEILRVIKSVCSALEDDECSREDIQTCKIDLTQSISNLSVIKNSKDTDLSVCTKLLIESLNSFIEALDKKIKMGCPAP